MRENSLSGSVNSFNGVNVIDVAGSSYRGSICPTEPKLVRVIRSFEKSRVREIGGEIIDLE